MMSTTRSEGIDVSDDDCLAGCIFWWSGERDSARSSYDSYNYQVMKTSSIKQAQAYTWNAHLLGYADQAFGPRSFHSPPTFPEPSATESRTLLATVLNLYLRYAVSIV